MSTLVKISSKNKPEEIRKALAKITSGKKKGKKLSDFYGKLPGTFGNGTTYQKKVRNEW
jgi:hypothetical protein